MSLCGVQSGGMPRSPPLSRISPCYFFEMAPKFRDALRRSCNPKGGHPCSTTSSVAPASGIASGPILWESGSRGLQGLHGQGCKGLQGQALFGTAAGG